MRPGRALLDLRALNGKQVVSHPRHGPGCGHDQRWLSLKGTTKVVRANTTNPIFEDVVLEHETHARGNVGSGLG